MPKHANKGSFKERDPRLIGNKFAQGNIPSEKQREIIKEAGKKTRFKNGHEPWNTGKERSEETRNKISETLKKKYSSGELVNKGGNKFQGFRRTNHRIPIFRKKIIEEVKECEICGFDNKYALVVHHKDGDKLNNLRENLELICSNCHYIKHKGKFTHRGDNNA